MRTTPELPTQSGDSSVAIARHAPSFSAQNRASPRSQLIDRHSRVLIVDDEPQNREVLEVMLAPEGYLVTSAVSGEEALAMVAYEAPDLILLDVLMPGVNGYWVAATLKADLATKSIPIIMVTALDDQDAKLNGLNAGADEVLSKPVDRAELRARVKNLLRIKAYSDRNDRYSETLEAEIAERTGDLADRSTALESAAIALRASEERTQFALRAARMGIWEVDLATQAIKWSDTLAPIFDLVPDQAPTDVAGFIELIHPDDRSMVEGSLTRAARGQAMFAEEFRVLLPGGGTRWVAVKARTLPGPDGRPAKWLGVGTDISERRSLEAQLRQAQKMDAVGQLAGGVAHDFNNILTAILGYSELVLGTLGPEDARRVDMGEIINAGHRAAMLTRQLLAFSRKQVVQPTAVDINAIVTGMRPMLSRLIGEQLTFVANLSPDSCAVRADAGQLEQVLMNLVVNARDAMPAGGRLTVETGNVKLDHTFLRDGEIPAGEYVMLAVSDSGVGMDAATKLRLFEPFFTTKAIGKGTGLGLATVYGIVKQNGGYIWVYSEAGQGATFKVFLPCVDAAELPVLRTSGEHAMMTGSETILLVEDDEAVRSLTCTILESAGYRVLEAANPQQAMALITQGVREFNLLVTDVIMPGSSGPELFDQLARARPALRVLYVSGFTDDTIVHHGKLDPGIDFLQKPFTAAALTQRVREVLDR